VDVAASEDDDAMAPVRQFIDGFDEGDEKSAPAACASVAALQEEPAGWRITAWTWSTW
jgi:hypothetical protein